MRRPFYQEQALENIARQTLCGYDPRLYSGTGEGAALLAASSEDGLEVQANMLGSAILMPIAQVKRCFYQLCRGRQPRQIVEDMAKVFQVSKQAMRIRLTNHRLL